MHACHSRSLQPQNLYAPDVDPFLTVAQFERSEEDNDELGISQMNTDHYE